MNAVEQNIPKMVKCEGGCGAMVREGLVLCTRCERFSRELDERYVADQTTQLRDRASRLAAEIRQAPRGGDAVRRSAGLVLVPRVDAGVVPHVPRASVWAHVAIWSIVLLGLAAAALS